MLLLRSLKQLYCAFISRSIHAFALEIQEELQREHACLDMIPSLQPNIDSHTDAQMLLPAAALHAAAVSLEHMLGCEVAHEEANVWVECVCSHAGTAMVMRACVVTQVSQIIYNFACRYIL